MRRKYTDILKESNALLRGTVITEDCGKSHKVKEEDDVSDSKSDSEMVEGVASGLKAMKQAGKAAKGKAAQLLKQRNAKMLKRAAAFETLTVSDMMGI